MSGDARISEPDEKTHPVIWDRVVLIVVVLVLAGFGGLLWATQGGSVFAQALVSLWSMCF